MVCKDPEKKKAYDRARYEVHKEEIDARCRIYREEHAEELKLSHQRYYAEHKEELRAKRCIARDKNHEVILQRDREYRNQIFNGNYGK